MNKNKDNFHLQLTMPQRFFICLFFCFFLHAQYTAQHEIKKKDNDTQTYETKGCIYCIYRPFTVSHFGSAFALCTPSLVREGEESTCRKITSTKSAG